MRIHSGNGEHTDMDNRAIRCFDEALVDVGLDRDERLRSALHDYFSWATRTRMSHYNRSPDDVPDDLRIRKWSWDGLRPRAGRVEAIALATRPHPNDEGSLEFAGLAVVGRIVGDKHRGITPPGLGDHLGKPWRSIDSG